MQYCLQKSSYYPDPVRHLQRGVFHNKDGCQGRGTVGAFSVVQRGPEPAVAIPESQVELAWHGAYYSKRKKEIKGQMLRVDRRPEVL